MKIRLVILVRVLGFLLGGIVAVLAALALMLWVSFDAERTGQALTRHFKDSYQRGLQLGHAPQLQLWPSPALLLKRVALTEPGRSEAFASADMLRLGLAIRPLLQRSFELRSAHIEGLSARLQRNSKGEWNYADLLSPADTGELPGWHFALTSVSLENTRLAIETPARPGKLLIQALELDAQFPRAGKAGRLSWQGELSDADSQSELRFHGNARLGELDSTSSGSLEDLRLSLEGNSHALKGASARIDAERLLWGRAAAEGSLAGLSLSLRGAAGAQAVDFSAKAPDLGWQGLAWQGRELNASLALRTVDSQREFTLKLPQLKAEATRGFSSAEAQLGWQQQTGKAHGNQGQFKFTLLADLLNPSLLASQINGELSVQHPRLHTPAARTQITGDIKLQSENSDIALKFALGTDRLQLKARLKQLWPLAGRFELNAATLDFDRLLAEARPGSSLPALEWPDLGGHALSGNIKLEQLRAGGIAFNSLSSPILIEAGQLGAEAFAARAYGGELSGKLLAEPTASRISAQGDFSQLPLERLALDSGLPIPLSGRLSGSYRLSTLLKPQVPLAANLSGAVRWNLSDAGLRGLDLQRSLLELAPAIQAGRMSARSPGKDESSELGTASSRFVIERGQLVSEKIDTRSNWLKLSGSGQADLLRAEMDFRLQAELLPATPRELAGLRGKALPLRIKGPLLHPDLRYEPASAALVRQASAPAPKK